MSSDPPPSLILPNVEVSGDALILTRSKRIVTFENSGRRRRNAFRYYPDINNVAQIGISKGSSPTTRYGIVLKSG
jgi:hypothetical protein